MWRYRKSGAPLIMPFRPSQHAVQRGHRRGIRHRAWRPYIAAIQHAAAAQHFLADGHAQSLLKFEPHHVRIEGLGGRVQIAGAKQPHCCESFLDYLFDDLGLHRVTIHRGVANARSCAITERLGFTREGGTRDDRWLDLVAWGMLEDDWRVRRIALNP